VRWLTCWKKIDINKKKLDVSCERDFIRILDDCLKKEPFNEDFSAYYISKFK